MKNPAHVILVLAISLMTITCSLSFVLLKKDIPKTENGLAIVELFTSEGCSSCPPADELVARIAKAYNGKSVYILSYHVDYWNKLGWKDPYSKAEFYTRQYQYGQWFNLRSIYTPQIVVNGKREFVGSNEQGLRKAIKDFSQDAVSPITLKLTSKTKEKLSFNYSFPAQNNLSLYIATVQKAVTTKVKRGENGGLTLTHINVVKSLNKFPIGENLSATIDLPIGFDVKTWEVINFVQNTTTGEIITAAQIVL